MKTGNDIIRISTSTTPVMFGTVGFVSKRFFFKNIEVYGIISIPSEISPFSESEVTILLPRTVLNIRFRPGQAYLFRKGGISPKNWRHHEPEVASSKFQIRRIPSSWVPLD